MLSLSHGASGVLAKNVIGYSKLKTIVSLLWRYFGAFEYIYIDICAL